MSRNRGVVVANPGAMRWMRPMASALHDADLLSAYVTPVIGGRWSDRSERMLPGRLGAIAAAFSLRPPPDRVTGDALRSTATVAELVGTVAARSGLPPSIARRANEMAVRRFDRGVSRMLRAGDQGVIGLTTASALTFRRAAELGVKTIVDYPTVHHRFSDQLMAEEARLVPGYAFSLQTVAEGPARRASAEAELQLADLILVNSNFARRTFIEHGIAAERVLAIPFGVELDQFVPPPQPRVEEDRFRVLFAGQITQRKGLSYLLEGFKHAAIPNAELILLGRVIGDGRPWAGLPNVTHLPPVPFHDLPPIYQGADAFVLPSLFEGFPQTALQAMASGLPTIVTDHTFGDDVITDGVDGFVIPIRDAGAIADRLRELYENPPLRTNIGTAARARAEWFSWQRYGERVVAAIRTLLDQ